MPIRTEQEAKNLAQFILDNPNDSRIDQAQKELLMWERGQQVGMPPAIPGDPDYVAAPEKVKPSPMDKLSQNMRIAGPAVGSMVGTAAGFAFGGPPGAIFGGSAGSAAGYLAQENIMDILRIAEVEDVPPPPDILERLEVAGKEAFLDTMFHAAGGSMLEAGTILNALTGGAIRKGFEGAARMTGRYTSEQLQSLRSYMDTAYARLLGVSEQGMRDSEAARSLGVEIGIIQATEGPITTFWSKVMGRFPFMAGQARPRMGKAQVQAMDAGERLFLKVGPSMNQAEIGIDMNNAATAKFSRFRDYINNLYEDAFKLAKATGATIPTKTLKWHAVRVKNALERRYGPNAYKNPAFRFFDEEVLQLPETISLDRYRGLSDQLDQHMAMGSVESFNISALSMFKHGAMERSLSQISDPRVQTLINEADGAFTRLMSELFETPTAQRFRRVEKKRFDMGINRQGTTNPDQAYKAAFLQQRDSVGAMKDLRSLVGQTNLRHATRRYLDSAWASNFRREASGEIKFDTTRFRRAIGLDDTGSGKYAALEEAMKGTGVSPEDLMKFVDTVDLTLKNVPADVNAFIARRGTLGGLRAVLSSIAPTAGAASVATGAGFITTLFGTLGTMVISRQFGRIVSTPRLYQAGMTLMNEGASLQMKKAALSTVVRMLDPEASENAYKVIDETGKWTLDFVESMERIVSNMDMNPFFSDSD